MHKNHRSTRRCDCLPLPHAQYTCSLPSCSPYGRRTRPGCFSTSFGPLSPQKAWEPAYKCANQTRWTVMCADHTALWPGERWHRRFHPGGAGRADTLGCKCNASTPQSLRGEPTDGQVDGIDTFRQTDWSAGRGLGEVIRVHRRSREACGLTDNQRLDGEPCSRRSCSPSFSHSCSIKHESIDEALDQPRHCCAPPVLWMDKSRVPRRIQSLAAGRARPSSLLPSCLPPRPQDQNKGEQILFLCAASVSVCAGNRGPSALG